MISLKNKTKHQEYGVLSNPNILKETNLTILPLQIIMIHDYLRKIHYP